jgi:PTS system nitrogen regulatory IIA component
MQLSDIIGADGVIASLRVASKKQLLQELSERASDVTGLDQRRIFETLLKRERLGSTGLGQGIAIPHGKFAELGRVHGLSLAWRSP